MINEQETRSMGSRETSGGLAIRSVEEGGIQQDGTTDGQCLTGFIEQRIVNSCNPRRAIHSLTKGLGLWGCGIEIGETLAGGI
jgi:hypothetical protein